MIKGLYKCFDHWHYQGTVWIYSDPHFNADEDLRGSFPNRPAANEQIKRINFKVGCKDTLILLGDIGDIECVKKLRGYKILVKGNHDIGLSNYEEVFNEIYGGPLMISEKIILSHEPLNINWAFNIHGHGHVIFTSDWRGHLNCCADVINYTPINFNQFIKSGRLKEIETIHRRTINYATNKANRVKEIE